MIRMTSSRARWVHEPARATWAGRGGAWSSCSSCSISEPWRSGSASCAARPGRALLVILRPWCHLIFSVLAPLALWLGDSWLGASRGLGMERDVAPRIRFPCRPELVILELAPPP